MRPQQLQLSRHTANDCVLDTSRWSRRNAVNATEKSPVTSMASVATSDLTASSVGSVGSCSGTESVTGGKWMYMCVHCDKGAGKRLD